MKSLIFLTVISFFGTSMAADMPHTKKLVRQHLWIHGTDRAMSDFEIMGSKAAEDIQKVRLSMSSFQKENKSLTLRVLDIVDSTKTLSLQ